MEAQPQRPSHEEAGVHAVEKKSVLKKVKDKAKKMKEAIKKHGHGHEHEGKGDKDDDKVHGAPAYSTVIRSVNLPIDKEEDKHKHKHHVNLEDKPKIPEEDHHSPNNTPTKTQHASASSDKPLSEYAHKFAETIAPLYDKVADEGEAVKGYLAEKLRPGDEEKALSEAITEELHKRKEAVLGVEEEEEEPRGKVTVSKEVADRLGTAPENKREGEDAYAAGEESSGQGVAERLTDAVSTWLGKSTGMQTARDSIGNSFVDNAGSGSGSGSGGGPMSSR